MNAMEPYQQQPAQPYPVNPYTPTYAPIVTPDGHDPVVWIPNAYGELVPMLRSQMPQPVQAAPARDLTPQPLFDPRAQVLAAGGVAAAGVGWGAGELLSAVAGLGTGALLGLAVVLVALRMAPAALQGGSGNTYVTSTSTSTTHVTNTNRWFGKSTSTSTTNH